MSVNLLTRLIPCSVALLSVHKRARCYDLRVHVCRRDQPLFIVSVAKHIFSHSLIEAAGEFRSMLYLRATVLARQVGALHGQEMISTEVRIRPSRVPGQAPFIKSSFANIAVKCSRPTPWKIHRLHAEATDFP